MEPEDSHVDPRTRRVVKGVGSVFDNRTSVKDDGKINRTKALFRELLSSAVYKELKELAYEECRIKVFPRDINSAITWHFDAIKRTFVDQLFHKIETLGKAAPEPEDSPVASDRTRLSFFAEN